MMTQAQGMKLKRVLGFTSNGRNSFVVQPHTGNVVYIAGCVVVILDPRLKTQCHLITNSKQSITTLAITEDGQYLAAANCGLQSVIYIWNMRTLALMSEFVVQNATELSCMSFSPDGRLLVSVGAEHDMTLSLWEWRRQACLISCRVATTRIRAVSFAADNSYFVTVGEAYAKYWYLKYSNTAGAGAASASSQLNDSGLGLADNLNLSSSSTLPSEPALTLTCRSATLGEQRHENFCDVRCGRGPMSGATFCLTKNGLLCELNDRRLLHKWVDLRTSAANCLAVSANIIVIGCANGVARCFNTTELRFLKNLPRPHSLGLDIATATRRGLTPTKAPSGGASLGQPVSYPSIMAVGLDEALNIISCIHNDHSLYTWDLSDPSGRVIKRYSALYHSSCIWGVDTYPSGPSSPLLPPGSFVTCSSDDTLRIWHPNVFSSRLSAAAEASAAAGRAKRLSGANLDNESLAAATQGGEALGGGATGGQLASVYQENVFSDELSKIVFTDAAYRFLCDLDSGNRMELNYDSTEGLRCLKIAPSGRQLAVGNRSGAIRVFDFELDREVKSIAAHDAEVLCLEYSDPRKFAGFCYLASSSRDKLIHLFDAHHDYAFLQTIDDHLSSITALRFVNNRARDALQLVSCGADQRIIFRTGVRVTTGGGGGGGRQRLSFQADQHIEGKTTFYDMEVDSESSCLMTACQDRMIRLFNVAQVRYQSAFRGSVSDKGTLIKIALDPSCTFLAASSTDKSISVYDYQRGECLASVVHGLSDLITDMKFSHDGRYLIACSGDGCIFVWKSPAEMVANGAMGANMSLAQLSLSSCSLGSLSNTNNNDTAAANKDDGDNLYEDLAGPGGERQAAPTSSSCLAAHQHQQLDSLNPLYRVQKAATEHDGDDPMAADEDDHLAARNHSNGDYATLRRSPEVAVAAADGPEFSSLSVARLQEVASRGAATRLGSWMGGDSLPRNLQEQAARLQVAAKAKLFQSRENLERISSREKFLNEGLAHATGSLADHTQARRAAAQVQAARLRGRDGNSSLSNLFANTKLNYDDRLEGGLSPTRAGGHHSSFAMMKSAKSTSSLLNVHVQGHHQHKQPGNNLALDNNFAKDNRQSNLSPSARSASTQSPREAREIPSSPSDDNEADQLEGAGASRLTQLGSGRPITPPRPSPHRQIRRNSANQHSPSSATATATTNVTGRAKAVPVVSRPLLVSTTSASALRRATRSECDLDLPAPSASPSSLSTPSVRQQRQQMKADNQPAGDGSIYCEKLDLSKLNPATVPLSQGLCQYVVDELQALSKYATRLHQRLVAGGNRSLANMVAKGVQNSMDILSIVPAAASRATPRSLQPTEFRSPLPASATASRRMMIPPKQPQPQSLRRPASSNSVLGIVPTTSGPTLIAAASPTPLEPTTTSTGAIRPEASGTLGSSSSKGYPMSHTTKLMGTAARSSQRSAEDPSVNHDRHQDNHDQQQQQQPPVLLRRHQSALAGGSSTGPELLGGLRSGKAAGAAAKSSPSVGQAKNNLPNLDQVLEAYSDRLFRMVQERMAAEQQSASITGGGGGGQNPPPVANGNGDVGGHNGADDNFASESKQQNRSARQ